MSTEYHCVGSMVTYKNPPEMVLAAATSFLNTDLNVKLYIVDNSPTPALREALTNLPVHYHFAHRNQGYGRGNNWAISQKVKSKYHVVLNPDVVIPRNVLVNLAEYMDSHEEVGIVCPKILNTDQTVQYLNRRTVTVCDLFLRGFWPSFAKKMVKKRLDYYEMRDIGYDHTYEASGMSGAFMFCRTSVLRKVGGFDPRYFMYFEDYDLLRKVRGIACKTQFFPFVHVIHHWERASHKSLKMMIIFIKSGIRYFNKWGWKFV